jgi:hypothetical protein
MLLTCEDETAKDTEGRREKVLSALETARRLTRPCLGSGASTPPWMAGSTLLAGRVTLPLPCAL